MRTNFKLADGSAKRVMLCFAGLLLGLAEGYAQLSSVETELAARTAAARNVYLNHFELNAALRIGQLYKYTYGNQVAGDQFLEGELDENSSILYDGRLFPNAGIRYDIHNNLVLVSDGYSDLLILDSRRISGFQINGRAFEPLISREGDGEPVFYEILFAGEYSRLLARRSKRLVEHKVRSSGEVDRFVRENQYIVITASDTLAVKSRKNLLQGLKYESELSGYIKKQKIRFNEKEKEAGLLKLLHFYESVHFTNATNKGH